MALTLRRTASEHVPEWDRDKFWYVYREGLNVGAIVMSPGANGTSYWSWTIQLHGPENGVKGAMDWHGRTDTREDAMSAFREVFDRYLAHVGPKGWAGHVEHMRELASRSGTKRY